MKNVLRTYVGVDNKAKLIYEGEPTPIYGAEWSGDAETTWTRTDAAKNFSDPNPAVANGNGSSPFDDIYPWSGMRIVEDEEAGTLVSIPKFYYKIGYADETNQKGLKIQICRRKADDTWLTSPAHADRGDGVGERSVVYVGRYHCASTYKSTTNAEPQTSVTRANFRTSIHQLGSDIWQYDYAMYWTIMMLYLVEFADWNSQKVIGYGCSNNNSKQKQNTGTTDDMIYHTGTNAASRTTYGNVQYRNIEGLWDTVCDMCDGIYLNGSNTYCIKNPAEFSDTTGGTLVGTHATSEGYISSWDLPSVEGFEYALYPNNLSGSSTTYVGDYCYGRGTIVFIGGDYHDQNQVRGAFFLYGDSAAEITHTNAGSRLMKLPNPVDNE